MFHLNQYIPDATATNSMIRDKEVLEAKVENMGKLKWNAILTSISKVAAMVAGPLIAAGIMGAAGLMLGGDAIETAKLGWNAVTAMLAVGAAAGTVSVASDYAATRIWQSKQFDNLELNAQSTARHLVNELKQHSMCMEYENPSRADGKSWQQFVQSQESGISQNIRL